MCGTQYSGEACLADARIRVFDGASAGCTIANGVNDDGDPMMTGLICCRDDYLVATSVAQVAGASICPRQAINLEFYFGLERPVGEADALLDEGAGFGARGGLEYGWNCDGDAGVDYSGGRRGFERGGGLGINHFDRDSTCAGDVNWELALPNGDYQVAVDLDSRGDFETVGTFADGCKVEGATVCSSQAIGAVCSYQRTVTVSDGRLTVTGGAWDTYRCHSIARVQVSSTYCDGGRTKAVFEYTGADQTYIVPAGITVLGVKLWGGGGGAGIFDRSGSDSSGGGGGFTQGNLNVRPGQEVRVIVGEHGRTAGGMTKPGYGGGGRVAMHGAWGCDMATGVCAAGDQGTCIDDTTCSDASCCGLEGKGAAHGGSGGGRTAVQVQSDITRISLV